MSDASLDPQRVQLVDDNRESWKTELFDRSRRNSLLYYRPLKVGTLELTHAAEDLLASLMAGRSVPLSRLFDEADLPEAQGKALSIRRKALANLEEKGLDTLVLAVGLATWKPTDERRPPESPVLLVPVEIRARGADGAGTSLRRAGDIQANEVLLYELRTEFGIRLDAEELFGDAGGGEEGEEVDVGAVFSRLRVRAGKTPGFDIVPRLVLGNFAFQKLAMVRDLDEWSDEIAANDLVAALAGDSGARQAIRALRSDVNPDELDEVHPSDELLILDADSSQRAAIHSIIRGQHGVIQGPPGTGKSQTIANLIAAMASEGKRILFVAEKRAALEAVHVRLEQVGLGHLALDLHGASVRRRQVVDQIRESLHIVREAIAPATNGIDERLEERRRRLNDHASLLRTRMEPFGVSPHDVLGELLNLSEDSDSRVTFGRGELDHLGAGEAHGVENALQDLAGLASFHCEVGESAWEGASVDSREAATDALRCVEEAVEREPSIRQEVAQLALDAGVSIPSTWSDAGWFLSTLVDTNAVLTDYAPEIFGLPLRDMSGTLALAEGGRMKLLWKSLASSSFRRARKSLRSHRRDKTPFSTLLQESRRMASLQESWGRMGSTEPRIVEAVTEAQPSFGKWGQLLGDLEAMTNVDFLGSPVDDVAIHLGWLAGDQRGPFRVAEVTRLRGQVETSGAGAVLSELRDRHDDRSIWPQIFRRAWLNSIWRRMLEEYPTLATFDGRDHESVVEEFRLLDREHVALVAPRIRRLHAEAAIRARNDHPEQDRVVSTEAGKKARHMPVRELFRAARDVLTALRPCWMASPLSVSQLLPTVSAFDLVVFDEASQVLPHDAVPALLRGAFGVVAGDEHQLPPTTFFHFTGAEDELEEETKASTKGFESLLDVMGALVEPPWSLQWHYRSASEELISFSNRHIYEKKDGRALITFPAPHVEGVVSHVLVDEGGPSDPDAESGSAEVLRVVDLILQHAEEMLQQPEQDWESLGVIAMGIKHSNRIQAALDRALESRADLAPFFKEDRQERMFVKNLERVQGDERDVIILSIGYGRDRSGTLPHRFGPINHDGGERRLNVAVTRAKKRMILVSSFRASDLDPRRLKKEGAKLLRSYLEYASSGGRSFGEDGPSGEPMNPFEHDVFETLKGEGANLIPQFGASRYRLDFAVQHPKRPGQFVLAIECDGATYHSEPTARDRDRLRQQELQARGWRFHRIWSTDWFYRKEEEIQRSLRAIEEAIAAADRKEPPPKQPDPVPVAKPQTIERSGRPGVRAGRKIDEYALSQLDHVMKWIMSDGRGRTEAEKVAEAMDVLGFRRRGKKIVSALTAAARRWRERHGG